MATWEIWVYDTWGNAEDGYEVNDRSSVGYADLSEYPGDQEIMDAISDIWDTSQIAIDNGLSDDQCIEIISNDGDEMPVGQLVKEE